MKLAAATLLLLAACATSDDPVDVGLEGLALESVNPGTAIPGTTLVIEGDSFATADWGTSRLHLIGDAGGLAIDVTLRADFVDYDHMAALVTPTLLDELGGDVDFAGDAIVEVESLEDGRTYASPPLPIALSFRRVLTPTPSTVQTGGVLFVNDAISVTGQDFLLGGTEGESIAIVTGCFQPEGGGPCAPVAAVEVPVTPESPFDRTRATFPFVPAIAGIEPGTFDGDVTFENRPAMGGVTASISRAITYDLVNSAIFRIEPAAASLGQYVFVEGGGFVGGEAGASTELHLIGTFTLTGTGVGAPVDLILIPEFVEGRTVRYVMNTGDALGTAIDLRQDTGTFAGTITPEVTYGGTTVIGEPTSVTLGVAPVKQVVHFEYKPTFVEALRAFGLRAADSAVRARILEVVEDAYPAVNLELRESPVEDFALYEDVELHGADPNGMGLFGYDNSPGKDTGNMRLYDRLGGVNASTQQDGFAGYGGVFLESFMSFSTHPSTGASIPGADATFDLIFDPIRPDRGVVITGADLGAGIPTVDGSSCPATTRPEQIACAIWVMGSLVGTTLAHEIGHSLGLANPYGEGFHDPGDQPGRLMDGGAERPFLERAELGGEPAAVFCDEEYAYLRMILPSSLPADTSTRPVCF